LKKQPKPYWPVPKRPVDATSKPGEGSSSVMDIYFPVFGYRIGVVFADDVNRTAGYYFSGFEPEKGTYAFHFPFKGENRAMVFLPFKVDVNTIAHESYHAVRRMLQHVGVGLYETAELEQIDNETMSYHLGYVVGRIAVFQKAALKSRRDFHAKTKHKLRRKKR
jgi:hypothetical protein